jgi:flagellar biosynthesis/type III secretory pathway protein FliH
MKSIRAPWGGEIPSRGGVVPAAAIESALSAERILRHAQAQADRMVEEGRRAAAALGEAASRAAEAGVWQRAAAALDALASAREALVAAAEPFVLSLTARVLERLLLDVPPDTQLQSCLSMAVRDLDADTPARLMVNPRQLEAARAGLPVWPGLALQADAAVPEGECLLVIDHCMTTRVSFAGNVQVLLGALQAPAGSAPAPSTAAVQVATAAAPIPHSEGA